MSESDADYSRNASCALN